MIKRAANGTRTRDLDLGKVALYQLSYCRIFLCVEKHSPECECKGTAFFSTCKLLDTFFSKKLHFSFSTLLYKGKLMVDTAVSD